MNNIINMGEQKIIGVFRLSPTMHSDNRGSFHRLFCKKDLAAFGFEGNAVQSNISHTLKAGTVRGLHYQKHPFSESKLIKCLSGSVFDVLIDLRETSETYLTVASFKLDSTTHDMLLVPVGVAHGFQTLVNDVTMIYFHSNFYSPEHECTINPNDPLFEISWPMPISEASKKDLTADYLDISRGDF